MKQVLVIVLTVLTVISLVACSKEAWPAEETTAGVTGEVTTEATVDPEQHYMGYCGYWKSTTQFHDMTISVADGMMSVEYFCYSGNGMRIATTTVSINLSDIRNDQAVFTYSDDGWGNSGTLMLDFSQPGQIASTTTTTYQDPGAMWSIVEGDRIFVQ